MTRLGRFEDYRFIGVRDTMIVYDCDVPEEFQRLEKVVAEEGLVAANQLQTFAPDTVDEARNRGFHPW